MAPDREDLPRVVSSGVDLLVDIALLGSYDSWHHSPSANEAAMPDWLISALLLVLLVLIVLGVPLGVGLWLNARDEQRMARGEPPRQRHWSERRFSFVPPPLDENYQRTKDNIEVLRIIRREDRISWAILPNVFTRKPRTVGHVMFDAITEIALTAITLPSHRSVATVEINWRGGDGDDPDSLFLRGPLGEARYLVDMIAPRTTAIVRREGSWPGGVVPMIDGPDSHTGYPFAKARRLDWAEVLFSVWHFSWIFVIFAGFVLVSSGWSWPYFLWGLGVAALDVACTRAVRPATNEWAPWQPMTKTRYLKSLLFGAGLAVFAAELHSSWPVVGLTAVVLVPTVLALVRRHRYQRGARVAFSTSAQA
jgi:hypothetical protein